MKKKVLSILVAVGLVATLVSGCGSSTSSTGSTTEKATTEAVSTEAASTEVAATTEAAATEAVAKFAEGKKVGFTVPSVGNDFMVAITEQLQKAMEGAGATVQLDSADGDVTKQISQIENYETMGVDVIIVWAVNGDGVSSTVKAAIDKGIPVMAFAMEVPGATCSAISASDEEMGKAAADMASDWIDKTFPDAKDGSVKVLVLSASSQPEAVTRSQAILSIKDNKKVNMQQAEVEDWNSTDGARSLIENTMLANPDINVIICPNGTTGIGAESYVMSSSSPVQDKSKFAIFCVDQTDEITAKIQSSEKNESVLRGTISMGTFADTIGDFMKCATPLLKGETPQDVKGNAYVVTPDTLKAQ